EVLAKHPPGQCHSGEFLTPGGIVLSGIQVHRFIGTAMDRQIRLGVAVKVVLAQEDTASYRFLKNPSSDRSALPHHLAGLPHVDRKQPHGHLGFSFPDTPSGARSLPQANIPLLTEDAERYASGAGNSWSEARAEAVPPRLQHPIPSRQSPPPHQTPT